MNQANEFAPRNLLCRTYYEIESELINGARGLDDWLLQWKHLRAQPQGLKSWTAIRTNQLISEDFA